MQPGVFSIMHVSLQLDDACKTVEVAWHQVLSVLSWLVLQATLLSQARDAISYPGPLIKLCLMA